MKAKRWIPLVLAIALGLVAAKLAQNAISKGRGGVDAGPTVEVVTAAKNVDPGAKLTVADLATVKVSSKSIPVGAYQQAADLIDRVAINGLVQGQQILENALAPVGTAAGVQALIPEGMRAITIQIDEFSGLGGHVLPGCKVDIIAVIRNEDDKGSTARTIAQSVEVRAVGRQITTAGVAAQNPDPATVSYATNVTLLVKPAQAEALQLASIGGKPWLVLRNATDAKEIQSEGTSIADLRGDKRDVDAGVGSDTRVTSSNDPFSKGPSEPSTSSPFSSSRTRQVKFIRNGKEETMSVEVTRTPAPETTVNINEPSDTKDGN